MTPGQYMMLQRETAIAIGRNEVAPEQVKISEVQGGRFGESGIHWHAAAPTGEFDCSALKSAEPGGGVRETLCVKK